MRFTDFLVDVGRPVAYYPEIAIRLGNVKAALFLCQFLYWHEKGQSEWTHKSIEEITQETGLSKKEQMSARKLLREQNLMEEDNKRLEHRVYYRVNIDRLNDWWEGDFPKCPKVTSGSAERELGGVTKGNSVYTETTSYTTPEITSPPLSPPHENSAEKKNNEEGIIKIWNEVVQKKLNGGRVFLDDDRRRKIRSLFSEYFNNDPELWRAYCVQVANCKFLMGPNSSGFRVTFDWAVKSSNARKVLEGVIYDKLQPDKVQERKWSEVSDTLKQQGHPEWWLRACEILMNKLGQDTFKSWIQLIEPGEIHGNVIHLGVKTLFLRDAIMQRHGESLEKALKTAYAQMRGFELIVSNHNG